MRKLWLAIVIVLAIVVVSDSRVDLFSHYNLVSYTGRELCPYDNCSLVVDNIGPGVYYLKCFCCKRVYVVPR
jgi:hypothetical protein